MLAGVEGFCGVIFGQVCDHTVKVHFVKELERIKHASVMLSLWGSFYPVLY